MHAATPSPDFVDDYRRLGAPVGCDIEHLKRCYRSAARQLHPDLREAGERADDEELKLVNAAYRRLLDYQREHGHLPGQSAAAAAARVRPPAPTDAQRAASGRPGGRLAMLGVAVLLALWGLDQFDLLPQGPTELPVAETAPAGPPVMVAREATARLRPVRVGDTKAYVRRVLGDPPLAEGEIWEYGPSHIRFAEGRVAGWHSSPLAPLAVDDGGGPTPGAD